MECKCLCAESSGGWEGSFWPIIYGDLLFGWSSHEAGFVFWSINSESEFMLWGIPQTGPDHFDWVGWGWGNFQFWKGFFLNILWVYCFLGMFWWIYIYKYTHFLKCYSLKIDIKYVQFSFLIKKVMHNAFIFHIKRTLPFFYCVKVKQSLDIKCFTIPMST